MPRSTHRLRGGACCAQPFPVAVDEDLRGIDPMLEVEILVDGPSFPSQVSGFLCNIVGAAIEQHRCITAECVREQQWCAGSPVIPDRIIEVCLCFIHRPRTCASMPRCRETEPKH